MRTSISTYRSFVLIMLLPIAGAISAFFGITDRNRKASIFLISLFSACLVFFIPPFQDLYRRFLETYLVYNQDTSYSEVITGKVDVIYYVVTLFFKKEGIPFFYISVLVVFNTVWNHLSALNLFIRRREWKGRFPNLIFFFYFCFINILIVALGLRMGWAVSFAVRGVISYYFLDKNKLKTSILLLILSALIHFSMLYVFFVLIASMFVRLNKKILPFAIVVSLLLGKALIPLILNKFGFGGLSDYALNGYIDNKSFANQGDSTNEFIVYLYYYTLAAFFIVSFFVFPEVGSEKYANFLSIYICSCFLLSSFYVAFNRYFVETGIFFYVLAFTSMRCRILYKVKYIIFVIALLNMSFSNIYLQRRPLMFGDMWESLFIPPVFYVLRTESDFEKMLNNVDFNGNWIGHDIK
ncbi:EpsG family protein [Tatumella sp. JGM118]|uniref:EpsG family protein n=1 Tax=Tatumella sp. JGM118 TaxID=2799796 RepID=UPI001BAF075F|nr:EpsG family protein [Tatumella sp. JGM118]MBS0910041.1 EpsG family protein [Tatumella sp. JGM118]